MQVERRVARHARWYRRLLVLYPARFRALYGDVMVGDVADQFRDEMLARPRGATLRVWWAIALDLLRSAPDQRWEDVMARVTALWIVYGLTASLAVSVVTKKVSAELLLLGVFVAAIRWAANSPDPDVGLGRLRKAGWAALAVGATVRPLTWMGWFADLLTLASIALLLFVHHYRRHGQPVAA